MERRLVLGGLLGGRRRGALLGLPLRGHHLGRGREVLRGHRPRRGARRRLLHAPPRGALRRGRRMRLGGARAGGAGARRLAALGGRLLRRVCAVRHRGHEPRAVVLAAGRAGARLARGVLGAGGVAGGGRGRRGRRAAAPGAAAGRRLGGARSGLRRAGARRRAASGLLQEALVNVERGDLFRVQVRRVWRVLLVRRRRRAVVRGVRTLRAVHGWRSARAHLGACGKRTGLARRTSVLSRRVYAPRSRHQVPRPGGVRYFSARAQLLRAARTDPRRASLRRALTRRSAMRSE